MIKLPLPDGKKINCVLQSRDEIIQATAELQNYGLINHGISAKDWDIARISPRLVDGDMLDMGSSGGSCILENAHKIGIAGRKVGIDLEYTEDRVSAEGIEFKKSDLMNTTFNDKSFQTIFCLSVLEHSVVYKELARETSRLLKDGGELWITCDYWDPSPDTSLTKLYALDWTILDRAAILRLIDEMAQVGLKISGDFDFAKNEAVINPSYCSPVQGVSYSFAILHFIKS